jgi:hypothetical protein
MQPKIVRRNYSDPLFQQSLLEAGMKLPRVSIKRTIVPMAAAQARLMLAALRDFRVQFEQMVEEAEAKGKRGQQGAGHRQDVRAAHHRHFAGASQSEVRI